MSPLILPMVQTQDTRDFEDQNLVADLEMGETSGEEWSLEAEAIVL